MSRSLLTFSTLTLLAVSTSGACVMKQTHGSRDSGQSRLMDDTFAGQNACNAEEHTKPFIIEWDATDASSFESLAASDIVFVKYEGCKLRVLDECKNDSFRGEQGAYKPPEWTAGSLETIDIENSGELYAKLPLAQASLGGRVSGGEKFHMEYFVAGTRYASRDAVYTADLDGRYGCDEATHFVYAYNLGAFALGSANEMTIEAGGSAYGFGAGGKKQNKSSAEKKGGDLGVCRADEATEVSGCKAPIRLNLRAIRPGESPEAEAMAQPDDPQSLSAAAVVNARMDMSDEARARYDAAMAAMQAGDGAQCIKELDAHDKLDPQHKSSDPNSSFAFQRSQCVMMAGKCDAGKVQMRKAMEKSMAQHMGPEQIDSAVETYAGMFCQGKMSDRDTLLKALTELQKGAYQTRESVQFCTDAYSTVKKLLPKVKPKNEDDSRVIQAPDVLYSMVPACYQRAGDCNKAYKAFKDEYPARAREGIKNLDEEQKEQILRSGFDSMVSKCKDKI